MGQDTVSSIHVPVCLTPPVDTLQIPVLLIRIPTKTHPSLSITQALFKYPQHLSLEFLFFSTYQVIVHQHQKML